MALAAGARLGPYQILEPIGAGGMGEVYRARDTRLDRIVAVKVLPSDLSMSPKQRLRVEREAKAVSRLSHPHICTLYDVGCEGESDFLVMEYLEGESLADRLRKGRLSVEQALRYASEIATGLHHAHRHGVVHRDLKPGNMMLTKSGAKLLDFGLAKLHEAESVDDPELASSMPTKGAPLTEEGTILGTYPYMAPEQLEGRPVDARTDLFAFGAILYEMVTGQRPFQGESRASLIAAIMSSQPRSMRELVPLTPPSLDRLTRHCLVKDPDERWQSAGDLAVELRWILDGGSETDGAPPNAEDRTSIRTPGLAVVAVGLLAAGILTGLTVAGRSRSGHENATPIARQVTFQKGVERQPALSPNGRLVAYVSDATGNADIYIQRVNGRNATNLTDDCLAADYAPSFSPDGNHIAFRSERGGGGIFVMGASGESVRRVSDLGYDPSWSPDGRRLVVSTEGILDPMTRQGQAELWTINLASGKTRRLDTAVDAVQPAWSPDGGRIAFWTVEGNSGQRDLATIDAEGLEAPVPLTTGPPVDWNPVWAPSGRELYFLSGRAGTMDVWHVAIDPATGRAEGRPTRVGAPAQHVAWLGVAKEKGNVAYVSKSSLYYLSSRRFEPERLRMTGEMQVAHAGALPIKDVHPSPDGTAVALTTGGSQEDLYVLEMKGGKLRQLTDDPFRDRGPQWSPDGSQVAFYSNRSGKYQVWSIRPDGSGLRQVTDVADGAWFPYWSPDGTRLAFPTGYRTCVVTLGEVAASSGECVPNPDEESWFQVSDWSHDGRWLVGNPSVAAGGLRSELLLWSFAAGEYKSINASGWVARWLPDSRHLLVLDEGGHLVVADRTNGAIRDLGSLEAPGLLDGEGLALSRDGRIVVVRSASVEADIWLLSPSGAQGDE